MVISFSSIAMSIYQFMHMFVMAEEKAVFDVEDIIELRESQNMKMNELRKALMLATENRNLILEKWHEHIG